MFAKNLKSSLALGLLAFLSSACVLQAHQVIASKVDKHYELKFWAHDGFESYKKEQFLYAQGYDLQGGKIKTGIDYKFDTPKILFESTPALIVTSFDAGYWSKTSKGYTPLAAYEAGGIVFDTLRSIKIGKTFFSSSMQLLQPLGLELEVTPLKDVFSLKPGDKLPVLVSYQGKPLAGAGFENQSDDLDELTNSYGIAFVPIKSKGLNIIAAKYEMPLLSDPQARRLLLQSSISFELK